MAATECLLEAGYKPEISVFSDRECGLLDWAKRSNYHHGKIAYSNKEAFSKEALEFFQEKKCQNILLYYTRIISEPLIGNLAVFNIHPSLLPCFKGLNAVSQALNARVKLFGSTLHRVNNSIDEGPILSQVAVPMGDGVSLERANRLSYFQKIWLTLAWVEFLMGKVNQTPTVEKIHETVMISSWDLADKTLKEVFIKHTCSQGL